VRARTWWMIANLFPRFRLWQLPCLRVSLCPTPIVLRNGRRPGPLIFFHMSRRRRSEPRALVCKLVVSCGSPFKMTVLLKPTVAGYPSTGDKNACDLQSSRFRRLYFWRAKTKQCHTVGCCQIMSMCLISGSAGYFAEWPASLFCGCAGLSLEGNSLRHHNLVGWGLKSSEDVCLLPDIVLPEPA
jgi:hypothetical protein